MANEASVFVTKCGYSLPIDDSRYLLPLLSPTSKGTGIRDSQPHGQLINRQFGRIYLQIHQILNVLREHNYNLSGKTMLDVGTGNGMVPRMLAKYCDMAEAVGSDLFLDGGSSTSFQPHNQADVAGEIENFIDNQGYLSYESYEHLVGFENYTKIPPAIDLSNKGETNYRFEKVGAHELSSLNQNFDFIYCKAIEHIHDWSAIFQQISTVSAQDALIYIKHRSFFSYLGAHRYASIGTPWGHILLDAEDYSRYVHEVYPTEAASMETFYFNDLSYPRLTVSEMLELARHNSFYPIQVTYEAPRYVDTVYKFIEKVESFWDIVYRNYPRISAEELFSGSVHIVLKRG